MPRRTHSRIFQIMLRRVPRPLALYAGTPLSRGFLHAVCGGSRHHISQCLSKTYVRTASGGKYSAGSHSTRHLEYRRLLLSLEIAGLACLNRTRYTLSSMGYPRIRNHVTIRFLHRTVLFLFTVLIALSALFVLGNIQNFLDSSQIIILRFLIADGVLLFLFAVFAFLFEFNYTVHLRKPYYIGRGIISVIACIFGLVIAIAASAILLLSTGLNPA